MAILTTEDLFEANYNRQEDGASMHSRGSTRHTISKVKFDKTEHTKSGRILFKTTPYRWVILLTFCGLIVNLTMQTVGFSSYVAQI